MKADLSRFRPLGAIPHVTRVLMQQGRVQLDSDWNEQNVVLLDFLWQLARHVIGPHGGPEDDLGFKVYAPDSQNLTAVEKAVFPAPPKAGDFGIGAGAYFVEGRLCVSERPALYTQQPSLPGTAPLKTSDGTVYHVYLDVWERYVAALQAEAISEVALGGVDTCGRAVLMSQVRVKPAGSATTGGRTTRPAGGARGGANTPIPFVPPVASPAQMRARTQKASGPPDPCLARADSGYRGRENQLYRVEVHTAGPAGTATFKWSRDNGSVVFGIESLTGNRVCLTSLGRDARSTLRVDDWVEVIDDRNALRDEPGALFQVSEVDAAETSVTLRSRGTVSPPTYDGKDAKYHPILRRWDHAEGLPGDGALAITEGASESTDWIELEDGIEVQFQPNPNATPTAQYRSGDYWLIPARTLTGDIEWRRDDAGNAVFVRPRGGHLFAPIAQISLDASGDVTVDFDLRRSFAGLAK